MFLESFVVEPPICEGQYGMATMKGKKMLSSYNNSPSMTVRRPGNTSAYTEQEDNSIDKVSVKKAEGNRVGSLVSRLACRSIASRC